MSLQPPRQLGRLVPFLCCAAPGLADVLVVDPAGGPGTYVQIQAAVNAAQDGDVVLVKSGSYAGFLVNQKGLAVVGDTGASVQITGGVRVRSVLPGQSVVLENLTAGALPAQGPYSNGLHVFDCAGAVHVERCDFTGATPAPSSSDLDGWHGMHVELSQRVSLVASTLRGGGSQPGWVPDVGLSGSGLHAVSATVVAYDTAFLGGAGSDNVVGRPDASHGGDGCQLEASELTLSGSSCAGGPGGDGTSVYTVLFAAGGDGGDGVDASSGSEVRFLESPATPGSAGTGFPFCCNGLAGLPRRGILAGFVDWVGAARHLDAPTPAREATTVALEYRGVPGDLVSLMLAREPFFGYRPGLRGVLLVQPDSPRLGRLEGTLPAGGALPATLELGDLGPGVEGLTLYLQALHIAPGGGRTLGAPLALVVLDGAY